MDIKDVAASLVQDAEPTSPEPEQQTETDQVTDDANDTTDDTETDQTDDVTEDQGEDAEEEQDDQPAEPEDDPGDRYTLTIDGEDHEVTLDELVQSYQIDGAARKRLQEATEAKQSAIEEGRAQGLKDAQEQIETRVTELNQSREQLAQMVGIVGKQLFAAQVERPDPTLEHTDPVRYLTEMEKWRDDQGRIANLQQQIVGITQQQREETERQIEETRRANRAALLQKRPDLREADGQQTFTANVRKAQEHFGFTAEEVNAFPDHRGLLVLDFIGKVLGEQTAQDPKTPAQRVVQKTVKSLTPGGVTYKRTERQKKHRADRDRAIKTGDYRDVAKLLVEDKPRK